MADSDGDSLTDDAMANPDIPENAVTNQDDIDDTCSCVENSEEACYDYCETCLNDNGGASEDYVCTMACDSTYYTNLEVPPLLDICEICSGNNVDHGFCSDQESLDPLTCEENSQEWTPFYFGPDAGCDGVCFSGIINDECNFCGGPGLTNDNGECIIEIYPGDTNTDGVVDENDLIPICAYWHENVQKRNLSNYSSDFVWPQEANMEYWNCKSYADANGDGLVNFQDIVAIKIHWGRANSGFNFLAQRDCISDEGISACNSVFNRTFENMSREEIQEFIMDSFGGNEIPTEFIVHKNYPNPFNPKTTIVYEVPTVVDIQIEIVNLRGQIIDDYIHHDIKPGIYNYVWDASNHSSGVYFYRFYQNSRIITHQKMIFIK